MAIGEAEAGYRTYEVYQRERVGQSTPLLNGRDLRSEQYLADPYPVLAILREQYPCYRDWHGNAFWITRYDDVTSVFVDDANFETRSKRWFYGVEGHGRDLGAHPSVVAAEAAGIDRHARPLIESILAEAADRGKVDLARDVAARFAVELTARVLGVPDDDVGAFATRLWATQRGVHADGAVQAAGRAALDELTARLRPLVEARRRAPGDDVVSAMVALELDDGPVRAEDVAVTLLEADHDTLPGALATMWFLLLTHPDQLEVVRAERRLAKHAYLEALRHSTPVVSAWRFARHEVERFGRLLPRGALVMCSAAAANRDPRAFFAHDPDAFLVVRKDRCQREPRGQYRADGLAAGVAFGLGPPSKQPAVPEDRPPSRYAIVRDTAVVVADAVLDTLPGLALAPGPPPTLRSPGVGQPHTCWRLPVTFERRSAARQRSGTATSQTSTMVSASGDS